MSFYSFNATNLTDANITSITSLFSTFNTLSGAWLMTGFSYVVLVLIFTGLYTQSQDIKKSLVATGFAMVVINSFLAVMGLLAVLHVIVPAFLVAGLIKSGD
jgi:hypothetical protein